MYLKLRLTVTPEMFSPIMCSLLHRLKAYGWVHEEDHYHLYLDTTCSTKTIRNDLNDWGLSGNPMFSVSELDEQYPIKYLCYMMKHADPVWFNVPEEILEEARACDAEFRSKKKKSKSLCSTILAIMSSQKEALLSKQRKDALAIIGTEIINYLLTNNLAINRNRVYDTSLFVYLTFNPSSIPHYVYSIFEKET